MTANARNLTLHRLRGIHPDKGANAAQKPFASLTKRDKDGEKCAPSLFACSLRSLCVSSNSHNATPQYIYCSQNERSILIWSVENILDICRELLDLD